MKVNVITIESVDQIINCLTQYGSGYIFRGQNDSTWDLKNGIERLFDDAIQLPEASLLRKFENRMLKKFKSIAHLYEDAQQLPTTDGKLGWLALMQHHGAPTRLVDYTSIPFMGLYFAIDGASSYSEGKSAVYCFSFRNINELSIIEYAERSGKSQQMIREKLSDDADHFYDNFIEGSSYGILWCLEPLRLNLRLRQQGGTFIVSDQINCKFQSAIDNYAIYDDITIDKIEFPHSMIPDISILLSNMGITNKQIYPGLDGLSKDIKQEMVNYITIGRRNGLSST